MAKIELTNPVANQLWKFFTSVKLTVVVLLLLAATSVIGTLIPQNASSAFYFQKYGEVFYRLFKAFDIFDMYHSWWFLMLLGLLGINLIICSIDRLSTTWKIIFPEKIVFNREQFRKIKEKKEFTSKKDVDELRETYKAFIQKKFSYVVEETTEKGVCIFGEKGRWTRFGVYIVHFSFLLLLGGGVIGGIWGYKGYVQLVEGESVKSVDARNGKGKIDLGFTLRCNTFDVSFYDTGQPDEYKSNVSVLEKGKEVLTTDIIVNDPLRYKGISFYQSNYGTAAGREVALVFKSRETGMVYNKKTAVREAVSLPEGGGRFILDGFVPGFDFRGHNLGEAFVGRVVSGNEGADKDEKEETIVMPIKFPFFDKMRKGAFSFEVEKFEKKYYTGLQVTKDPGVWYVYLGFIFMIIGCWITFFMSHQRICVEVEKGSTSSRVIITGTAHRNSQSMKIKTAGIAEKMKEI